MVLCAFTDDDSKVRLVEPPEGAPNGARVLAEGYDGEPATENQVLKKKVSLRCVECAVEGGI